MRFALVDLPPALRAQAEAQLRANGALRDVRLLDGPAPDKRIKIDPVLVIPAAPKEPQKPECPETAPRGAPRGGKTVGSIDLRPRRRLGQKALATPTGRLLWQLHCAKLPEPVREYRFYAARKWRFDLAWPDKMLALEIEGITYQGGRHQRPAGFISDCRKYNQAALLGWTLLRVTPDMIRRAEAIRTLEEWFSRMT